MQDLFGSSEVKKDPPPTAKQEKINTKPTPMPKKRPLKEFKVKVFNYDIDKSQ
jgi:hypothetical protein